MSNEAPTFEVNAPVSSSIVNLPASAPDKLNFPPAFCDLYSFVLVNTSKPMVSRSVSSAVKLAFEASVSLRFNVIFSVNVFPLPLTYWTSKL